MSDWQHDQMQQHVGDLTWQIARVFYPEAGFISCTELSGRLCGKQDHKGSKEADTIRKNVDEMFARFAKKEVTPDD